MLRPSSASAQRLHTSATGARIMKTVIQNVIGTIASAYSRSSSVAMRGASGCVDSRSCVQGTAASGTEGHGHAASMRHRAARFPTMRSAVVGAKFLVNNHVAQSPRVSFEFTNCRDRPYSEAVPPDKGAKWVTRASHAARHGAAGGRAPAAGAPGSGPWAWRPAPTRPGRREGPEAAIPAASALRCFIHSLSLQDWRMDFDGASGLGS